MSYVVAKPFNTVNRRFAVGAPVSESDDLSSHGFMALKENGFIAAQFAAAGEPRASGGRSRALADKGVTSVPAT